MNFRNKHSNMVTVVITPILVVMWIITLCKYKKNGLLLPRIGSIQRYIHKANYITYFQEAKQTAEKSLINNEHFQIDFDGA